MPTPNIDDALTAMQLTLDTTPDLRVVLRDEDIKEGIGGTPMMMIYWESEGTDIMGDTSMTTFRTGLQSTDHIFHLDLYARRRSHIGIDLQIAREQIDNVREILRAQAIGPFFGVPGIWAMRWTASRVVFEYGGKGKQYAGVRFVMILRFYIAD